MSVQVFISHKSSDKGRLQAVRDGLEQAGFNVWWDADTSGGTAWRQAIVTELDAAGCVLVCWSQEAVTAAWVLEEAERAKKRSVLLPVRIDPVEPPFGFAEIQTLDLIGWQGDEKAPHWLQVLASVRAILSGESPSQVAPLPKRRGSRRFLLGAGGLTALLALAAWFGLRSDPAETAAWQSLTQAAPGSLHRSDFQLYLRRFPQGAHAAQARQAMAACRDQPVSEWRRQDDTLPLPVASQQGSSERQARAALQAALPAAAADICSPYRKNPEQHRLLGVRFDPEGIHCQATAGRWHCGFDGQAVCQLEVRRTTMQEICP